MSVQLSKGGSINLRKEAPQLNRLLVGLGWDPVEDRGPDIDIDASIICIDDKGRKENIVYYGALTHPSGAIRHCGDNLTGEGDGDDEQIQITLDKIPSKIEKLSIIMNIYECKHRHQHFGQVSNCFIHVVDLATNRELVRYDINDNYNKLTGIFVADIYRYKGEWKFKAIGEGVKVKDIKEMVQMKCR